MSQDNRIVVWLRERRSFSLPYPNGWIDVCVCAFVRPGHVGEDLEGKDVNGQATWNAGGGRDCLLGCSNQSRAYLSATRYG